jgi:hypothetical protein
MTYLIIYCVVFMFNISDYLVEEKTILQENNWMPNSRFSLEKLISENANQNKIVVLDFDNTILCGDIGESLFQLLVKEKIISTDSLLSIYPSFNIDRNSISLGKNNFNDYYNQLLNATDHSIDEAPHSVAYAWVVQIMQNINLNTLIEFTDSIMFNKTSEYNNPFFYPEMIDLVGVLIKNGFQVNIVSASNIWSVRRLVGNFLNPLLKKTHGDSIFIDLKKVYGMNTLLKNNLNGQLYKDEQLLNVDEYLYFESNEIKNYSLTSLMNFPATSYYGKVAAIIKNISKEKIFLVAGDSPNDFAMQNFSENVLWIARLNKTQYQEKAIDEIRKSDNNWIIQPTLTENKPGFIKSFNESHTKKPHYNKSVGLYKNYFTN